LIDFTLIALDNFGVKRKGRLYSYVDDQLKYIVSTKFTGGESWRTQNKTGRNLIIPSYKHKSSASHSKLIAYYLFARVIINEPITTKFV
jgi:hypothetical protein